MSVGHMLVILWSPISIALKFWRSVSQYSFFVQLHRSTPDLPVAHIIRELVLCRDDNSTFLLTSVEMSQVIEYLCTI